MESGRFVRLVVAWIFVLAIASIAVAAHRFRSAGRFGKPLNAEDFVVEKKGLAAHGKFWKAVGYFAGAGFLSLWLAYIGVFEHYDATRPTKPDVSTRRVVLQNNHGHFVYLSEQEEGRLLALQRISMGFALVGVLATYFYKRTTGKLPE